MSETAEVRSIINCDRVEKAQVVLLAVPYDGTSSFGKGADNGPAVIRACLDRQIELLNFSSGITPADKLKIAWRELPEVRSLSPEEMVLAVEAAFGERHYQQGQFTLVVGGEHSVPIGVFKSLSEYSRASETTIVQIDAHLDLRQDDSDFVAEPHGPFAHCSVMRRAAEMGFQIVNVGARAYSTEELDFARSRPSQIALPTMGTPRVPGDLCPNGTPDIYAVLRHIKTEKVYLTLDVDGLDPAYMPATGTPVPGGLPWWFVQDLIQMLFQHRQVIGADLVEVAVRDPKNLDHAERLTAYGAAQLIYDMIGGHCLFRR